MRTAFVFAAFALLVGCSAEVEPATEELRQTCGGIAAFACPDGYECVYSRRCEGADCTGTCRRSRAPRCDYSDPSKHYVGTSTEECSLIRFICAEGQSYFSDACGCGCQDACTSIALCVDGYVWDDATCTCQPAPGEACGPVTCAAGEVCCNASCGICTPPGYFCTQQFCDGTEPL